MTDYRCTLNRLPLRKHRRGLHRKPLAAPLRRELKQVRPIDKDRVEQLIEKYIEVERDVSRLSVFDKMELAVLLTTERDFRVTAVQEFMGVTQGYVSGLLTIHDRLSEEMFRKLEEGSLGYARARDMAVARLSPEVQREIFEKLEANPADKDAKRLLKERRAGQVAPGKEDLKLTRRRLLRHHRAEPTPDLAGAIAALDFALGGLSDRELFNSLSIEEESNED